MAGRAKPTGAHDTVSCALRSVLSSAESDRRVCALRGPVAQAAKCDRSAVSGLPGPLWTPARSRASLVPPRRWPQYQSSTPRSDRCTSNSNGVHRSLQLPAKASVLFGPVGVWGRTMFRSTLTGSAVGGTGAVEDLTESVDDHGREIVVVRWCGLKHHNAVG